MMHHVQRALSKAVDDTNNKAPKKRKSWRRKKSAASKEESKSLIASNGKGACRDADGNIVAPSEMIELKQLPTADEVRQQQSVQSK